MRFETTAPEAWERYIHPYLPLNFGLNGDETGDLLYRLQSAGIEGLSPEFCTVLIGVNDLLNGNDPEVVAYQIREITIFLAEKFPASTILLYTIFPAENYPGVVRMKISQTNSNLSALTFPKQVRVNDITSRFLNVDGTLNDAILPDQIHLSRRGYAIWGESINTEIGTREPETN
jgi:lysophospholipase L1-like esterase